MKLLATASIGLVQGGKGGHGVSGGSLVCASERGHSALMFPVLGSSLAC